MEGAADRTLLEQSHALSKLRGNLYLGTDALIASLAPNQRLEEITRA